MIALALLMGLVIAGCGASGGTTPSAFSQVVVQASATPHHPVTDESLDRARDIILARARDHGVQGLEVQRQGPTRLALRFPEGSETAGLVSLLIRPAQLDLYDYQANLVTPEAPSLYSAATRAATLKPTEPAKGQGPFYYLFSPAPGHPVVAGPEVTLAALRTDLENSTVDPCGAGAFPGTCQVVKVPKGLIIFKNVQQLPGTKNGPTRTLWDIMQDRPALVGKDITSARQQFQQGALSSNEPIVTMSFTGDGRKAFANVTKDLATRGALRNELQSFAIVLDGAIISNPTVDYQQYPTGIDGSNGAQIQGNFTVDSAKTLADQIDLGALPVRLSVVAGG